MKKLKKFKDNCYLISDSGQFDEYCIYISNNGKRIAPTDEQIFNKYKILCDTYGNEVVFNDYVSIYEKTSKLFDESVFDYIKNICKNKYINHKELSELLFSLSYATMVAEENKAKTVLGKKVKFIGFYQFMILNHNSKECADYSKGKKGNDLKDLYHSYMSEYKRSKYNNIPKIEEEGLW